MNKVARQLRVALAGNPNCGKSTLFNSLTGSQQHVGNWPGKTVARKEGYYEDGETQVEIVDLPGTYSLSAYSPEEQIARDYIVQEQPDVVVNVLDAANLERNLYLTTQILETGAPLVLVLNMSDVAAKRGYLIDVAQLSQRLGGVAVIEAVANRGEGLAALREAIVATAKNKVVGGELTGFNNGEGLENGAYKRHATNGPRLRGCH